MGVPKFFRWMSERYPAISQLIAENRIPEFDCLYLDMNGIIHNCTHKDSDGPTVRLSEDKMFIAIFNYIEHLFGKIKPKQLFFMAIDGVAPRAKMNQQRARRFRTALDAEVAREKALKEGLEMPKEDPFDSNCITPGTEFMAKLTEQLKYFINKKVSEDVDWQGVEVVLSGHEVPGEGEHKIMEYIRLAKAQPGYDPNVRHCLYGLDADLIMLGLLSHDPHFCLLREEVSFGRQNQKKSKELEHQNFFLMHLCVVREYLELEFQHLKEPGVLGFEFDMERVIDDFILMAFFVGNDFLPNLPNLHINEGALAFMFNVYKTVLPKAGGYINERGVINLQRLTLLVEELSKVEFRFFESENADASWLKGKQMMGTENGGTGRKGRIVMSSPQKDLYKKVKSFVNQRSNDQSRKSCDLPSSLPARDRKFVEGLADSLRLQWKTVQNDRDERHLRLEFPQQLGDDDEEDDEEASAAVLRVFKQYDKAQIVDVTAEEAQEQMEKKYQAKYLEWKDQYYRRKFDWGTENKEEMRKLSENYVQGLQWVLYYYYMGVASWPWFYGYHYAPMVSDVKLGMGADLNFTLGQPFRPYQQLMGVLPDRSKKIIPTPYHELMTDPKSPIYDFYPRDFELDMNGKKMEWEAVVKIPFIDEKRLLPAMATRDHLLSSDEKSRNDFGVALKFAYSPEVDFTYPSSLTGIFPHLSHCHCVMNTFDLPTLEGLDVHVGLVDGARLGTYALAGFPSLKVLPHTGTLGFHGVNVFQQDSRNESQVITFTDPEQRSSVEASKNKLGRKVHVGYPFLQEAKIVRVSDELFDYIIPENGPGKVISVPHGPQEIEQFHKKADKIENVYSKRLGMLIGHVDSLVHVDMLKGLKKTADGAFVKEFDKVPGIETDYAAQTIVDQVESEDQRFLEKEAVAIEEEFPEGTRAFFLGEFNYGRPLEVVSHQKNRAEVWVSTIKGREPEFGHQITAKAEAYSPYTPSFAVAKMLNLNPLVLSRITSSFSVLMDEQRQNLGLNLKFEGKKQKVLGYSRRGATGWEFSQKAINLLQQYMVNFPHFIAGIMRNPQADVYRDTDFYAKDEAKAKMREIQNWLKSVESKNFERVPLEAEQLDSDVVKQVEEAADQYQRTDLQIEAKKIKAVPRNALLKPADAEQRLGNQHFALGDRIVYVQDSGKVPIASRGTVVGMTRTSRQTLLDVVFDITFMSGTSLGDRCSPFRGSTVPASSVLNISHRQVVAGSRAAVDQRAIPPVQPLTVPGYGAPAAAGGKGQYVNAAPPPAMQGSFSGILRGGSAQGGQRSNGVNGGHRNLPIRNGNGHRGGHGHPSNGVPSSGPSLSNGRRGLPVVNQKPGYGPIDMTGNADGVVQQNPSFRPQQYNNVAPPANLETGKQNGRGRGRGRGGRSGGGSIRGNGSRGRGRASAVTH